MRIKKKFFSICLSLILSISAVSLPLNNVFAEGNIKNKEIIVSEDYAKAQREGNNLRYGESEKSTVVKTEYKTKTVKPQGQPTKGYNFPNGGFVYVNTSKGASMSVSFALSWGNASVSVTTGSASPSSSIGGVSVKYPADKNYYVVKTDKKYKFERLKIDVYQYGQYKYTYYTTRTSLYSQSTYRVKS